MVSKYGSIISRVRANPKRSLSPFAFDLLSVLEFMWERREGDYIRLGNSEGAEILGCTPTQISRVMKELDRKKLIRVEWHGRGNEERRVYFDE